MKASNPSDSYQKLISTNFEDFLLNDFSIFSRFQLQCSFLQRSWFSWGRGWPCLSFGAWCESIEKVISTPLLPCDPVHPLHSLLLVTTVCLDSLAVTIPTVCFASSILLSLITQQLCLQFIKRNPYGNLHLKLSSCCFIFSLAREDPNCQTFSLNLPCWISQVWAPTLWLWILTFSENQEPKLRSQFDVHHHCCEQFIDTNQKIITYKHR